MRLRNNHPGEHHRDFATLHLHQTGESHCNPVSDGIGASSFTPSSNGVLTFKNTPDYEDPPGYTVTVNADADGDTATKTVTINIQNLE